MTTYEGRLTRVDGELWLEWDGRRRQVKNLKWLQPSLQAAWRDDPSSFDGGVEVELKLTKGTVKNVRRPGEPITQRRRPAGEAPGTSPRGDDNGPNDDDGASDRFLNPYGFVPWVRRSTLPGELRDHAPAGHDRRRPKRWSGTIDVRIEAVTPLLLLDADRATTETGHRTVPLDLESVDGEERPRLAPSALKGSLRAAYEAVTGSRLGVFSEEQHGTRLAYRMDARDGLETVPARVSDDGSSLELLRGTSRIGQQRQDGLHAAWLPAYETSPGEVPRIDGRRVDRSDHGRRLWAILERLRKEQGDRSFEYWRVRALAERRDDLPERMPPSDAVRSHVPVPDHEMLVARGYVFWTDRNIGNKHDERFFFTVDDQPTTLPLDDELRASWNALIRSYQQAHEGTLDRGRGERARHDYLGPKPGKTAWSPHQYEKHRQTLEPGQLLYVLYVGDRPAALLPVTVARRVYDQSPWEQLPKEVRPASSLEQLSPADRVFGWVNAHGHGAHAGQLRIRSTRCTTSPAHAISTFDKPLPLAILSSPKPTQGRFYVGTFHPDGSIRASGAGTPTGSLYTKGTKLRGHKRYWHHADLAGKWPQQNTGGAFSRSAKDDQNVSIEGWVTPGTTFEATLEVTDLNDLELGALLWLLDLPEGEHHRLGYGKPLGFGSVRITITGRNLADGDGWKAYWSELSASTIDLETRADTLRGLFEQAVEQNRSLRAAVDAFRAMARGRADLPVHYPRTAEQSGHDELYKWFVENARQDRLALPDVTAADPSLPRLAAGGTRGGGRQRDGGRRGDGPDRGGRGGRGKRSRSDRGR